MSNGNSKSPISIDNGSNSFLQVESFSPKLHVFNSKQNLNRERFQSVSHSGKNS